MAFMAFIMIKRKRQCYYTPTRNVKKLEELFNLKLGKPIMTNKQTDHENNHFQKNKVKNLVIK
jgi:hypothetical protein